MSDRDETMRVERVVRVVMAVRVVTAALVLAATIGAASAQGAADDAAQAPDPPGRVGRLSELSGPVSLVDPSSGAQEAALLNWPITSGNELLTGNAGQAEVRIGSLALRLGGDSDVQFARIDDAAIEIVIQRGTVAIRPRSRDGLRDIQLSTPRERIVLDDVGRYRIDVDRVPDLTAVTTRAGYARVLAGDDTDAIAVGQRGEIFAGPPQRFQYTQTIADPFDEWVYARERRDDDARSAQYASPELTGIESLDDHGVWRSVPDYGEVWYPSALPAGWAPYRDGRWAFIAPWGWTWIDAAPWGFAPFHYGRWALAGGSWAWVPGTYQSRPCYAPAMVGWYGAAGPAGPSGSASFGGPVGWFPLGPGEVYLPGYQVSHRYLENVNIAQVANIRQLAVINPPARYAYQRNPAAATWVERDAMTAHRSIGRSLQPPPARWLQAPVARAPALPAPPVPSISQVRPNPGIVVPPRVGTGAPSGPAVRPASGSAALPARDARPPHPGPTPPPTPAVAPRREPDLQSGNRLQRSGPATPAGATSTPASPASAVPHSLPAEPMPPVPALAAPRATAGAPPGPSGLPGNAPRPETGRPQAQPPAHDSRERDQDRDRSRER